MVEVGSFTSRGHAEMAAGMLDAHGIRAHVRGDDAGGAVPHVAFGSHGYRLAVDEGDAADAEVLLAGDESGDGDEPAADAQVGWLQRRGPLRLLVGALAVVVVFGVLVSNLS